MFVYVTELPERNRITGRTRTTDRWLDVSSTIPARLAGDGTQSPAQISWTGARPERGATRLVLRPHCQVSVSLKSYACLRQRSGESPLLARRVGPSGSSAENPLAIERCQHLTRARARFAKVWTGTLFFNCKKKSAMLAVRRDASTTECLNILNYPDTMLSGPVHGCTVIARNAVTRPPLVGSTPQYTGRTQLASRPVHAWNYNVDPVPTNAINVAYRNQSRTWTADNYGVGLVSMSTQRRLNARAILNRMRQHSIVTDLQLRQLRDDL